MGHLGILLQLCARTCGRQRTDIADVCHHSNSGPRSRSIIGIPGKMHFALLGGRKYLVHRVAFDTSINRIQAYIRYSFPTTYIP